MPGPDAHCRVSVARGKPRTNPRYTTDLPRYLPAGLTQYVLNNYTTKSPPFHVTADDVSVPIECLEVDKIPATGPYKAGAESSQFSMKHSVKASCGHPGNANRTPLQLRQANRVYRPMRVGGAHRELARDNGARFLPPGYSYVNHKTWGPPVQWHYPAHRRQRLVQGPRSSLVARKFSAHTPTPGQYVVRFLAL